MRVLLHGGTGVLGRLKCDCPWSTREPLPSDVGIGAICQSLWALVCKGISMAKKIQVTSTKKKKTKPTEPEPAQLPEPPE